MRRFGVVASIIIIFTLLVTFIHSVESEKSESFSPYVDEKGGISLPTNFRNKWTYLGVWLLHESKDMMHAGIHEVFTQPGVVEGFKGNGGEFPDGAVLVKEVRSTKSAALTTSPDVVYTDKVTQWFVMIKDQKGRFPDNPKWGNGWGWALYYAKDPSKDVSTDYKKDCLGCHIPAKNTDWIYIQGYPALNE